MINTRRFKKIRTLKDIKLEKANLRYEMLLAENKLMEDIKYMEDFFSFSSIFSRANKTLNTAIKTYSIVAGIFGLKRRSDKGYKED